MTLPLVPLPTRVLTALAAVALTGCVAAGAPEPAATYGTAATGAPVTTGAPVADLVSPAASPPGAGTTGATGPSASPGPVVDLSLYTVAGGPAAGPLALTTDAGAPFDLASLRGGPVLVYFGYTHCPDVCPATTGVLAKVLRSTSAPVRVVFVTVDPERDTAPVLHEYLSYLPPGFVGLTGGSSAVRAAADGYGVDYERVDTTSASGYAMAHTADVFLVDADGRLRDRFPFGTDAAVILAAIAALGA